MPIFRLTADALFKAVNVEEAFLVLADHLMKLADASGEVPQTLLAGSIKVEPYREKKGAEKATP